MFGGWLELGQSLCCLLFIGFAIKMIDDGLDAQYDGCRGVRTLAVKLNRASLPYSVLATLIGAAFNVYLAIGVFLASYAVGMFTHPQERLPTGLPAYVETLLAIVLAILLVGVREATWAVAMMCVIDWLDDIVDITKDKSTGQHNLAQKFGVVEMLFGVLIALCIAVACNVEWTALTFIAVPLLNILFESTTTKLISDDGGE